MEAEHKEELKEAGKTDLRSKIERKIWLPCCRRTSHYPYQQKYNKCTLKYLTDNILPQLYFPIQYTVIQFYEGEDIKKYTFSI